MDFMSTVAGGVKEGMQPTSTQISRLLPDRFQTPVYFFPFLSYSKAWLVGATFVPLQMSVAHWVHKLLAFWVDHKCVVIAILLILHAVKTHVVQSPLSDLDFGRTCICRIAHLTAASA